MTIVACCSLHPQAVDDWSRVIGAAESMVARNPADDWSHVHLFLTLCQAGQVEEAYRRVPDIESKANSWRWVLALGEALRGNHQRAAEVLDDFEQRCRTALGFEHAVSLSTICHVRTLIADFEVRR